MTPYYSGELCRLYHGDCREFIDGSKEQVDLIVTDPPYGCSYVSSKSRGKWGRIAGDNDAAASVATIGEALGLLKRGRHVYVFGDLDLSTLKLCKQITLIWDKGMIGMGDLTIPWGPEHEPIAFAVYEPSKANREKGYGRLSARLRKGSVLRSLRPNSGRVKHHPTEKPVDIIRQMIESSSMLGETVFDPFCGSGSTLIAAKMEDRRAVGVEIEERYCETAAKRLSGVKR